MCRSPDGVGGWMALHHPLPHSQPAAVSFRSRSRPSEWRWPPCVGCRRSSALWRGCKWDEYEAAFYGLRPEWGGGVGGVLEGSDSHACNVRVNVKDLPLQTQVCTGLWFNQDEEVRRCCWAEAEEFTSQPNHNSYEKYIKYWCSWWRHF